MAGSSIVGVISDTHGTLRRDVLAQLEGAALIIHAGDVGSPEVLETLRSVAPVHAVRGNVDRPALGLPLTCVVPVEAVLIYVLHDLGQLDLDPAAAGFAAVVSGHSHRPALSEQDGVLYLNPGSAGPRRWHLPVSMARLVVSGTTVHAELLELEPGS